MTDRVTFTIPGRAYQAVAEGGYRHDCPAGWAQLSNGAQVRAGRGVRITATLDRAYAEQLADYLWSVSTLWREMTATERGSDDPRPLEAATAAIQEALA